MSRDKELAAQVAEDFTKAQLSSRERAVADFTVKVTRAPNACSPRDIELLRSEGLSDRDIVELVQMISYFNMSNRIFESLSTVDAG